ncbi:shikimate kinase [Cyanobium sp. FGCU-6]|jgi:shikimate kinase|nr:shikimate kinase [Cyanobium sp. FGCU6]
MLPTDQPSERLSDPRALARRLQGLNLYLVGMMGAGKSAVGRPLADALGYTFIDADDTLERVAGRSIPEVFAEDGEEGFRLLETQVLNQIACIQRLVVATGGGVVTRPQNWGHLRQGVVVWLDAPEPLLLERLRNDPTPRPLLNDADSAARLGDLLGRRRPLYAQADLTIRQDGRPPEAVAAQVLAALPTILRELTPPPQAPATLVDGEGRITPSLN